MTMTEQDRAGLVHIVAGLGETMRSTMAAAFSGGQEMDAIHLAFAGGYEKGFADALRTVSVASGLSVPGLQAKAGGTPESGPWDQAGPGSPVAGPAGDVAPWQPSVYGE
jgi:hypothetical protein